MRVPYEEQYPYYMADAQTHLDMADNHQRRGEWAESRTLSLLARAEIAFAAELREAHESE